MQFHHHGYVSQEPRRKPASGTGIDRQRELPDEMDVLIVGSGPAGMLLAAQMSHYPSLSTRVIERRPGRLELGQADGIQPRSVETFQAFGFAEHITAEAYNIGHMNFWNPDPQDPGSIIRTERTVDYADDVGEFPHLIVNQARVLDYFAEAALFGPARIEPDYGVEFVDLKTHDDGREFPVDVEVRYTAGDREGESRTIRAKYVIGCDGAHSRVRKSIGRQHIGGVSMHAWGVMDVLVNTDFPDWRVKCAINAQAGNILHIPREGGYLARMYIDLGDVGEGASQEVRNTPVEKIIEKANDILKPYTLDVRHVAWHSVYEVGHRVTDRFDDAADENTPARVFLTGDACHTHSAKAGQGMNVSMQDGFNLGWKLGSVLTGLSTPELLSTYSAERQPVAQQLIDFDREWSTLMARKPEEIEDPKQLATYYLATAEFPSGFMTQYDPSLVIGSNARQELAAGFPLGKRFKSEQVTRLADGNTVHLGHHHRADGRWRVYVFADAPAPGEESKASQWAAWADSPDSFYRRYTPTDGDVDAVFDLKVVYQQPFQSLDIMSVPKVFLPQTGPFNLIDWEKVYCALPAPDFFEAREVSREGAVVVVRPDQYVAHILPLDAYAELDEFFAGFLRPQA